MSRCLSALAVATLLLLPGVALAQAPKLDPDPPGLEVGAKAPEFTLPDQDGKPRSLESLLKEGHVAIVFYRSGSW